MILDIFEKHPLRAYQNCIKKTIEKIVEEQIALKNSKVPLSNGGIGKRKELNRELVLRERLSPLKSQGVHAVAARLFKTLYEVEKRETQDAANNSVKAAAQCRMLLPGIDITIVKSLIQWIHQQPLNCTRPDSLYDLLNLANHLGVEALAETCLSKLCNAATDSMHCALAGAVPLANLLGYGSGAADPVLEVIFINVFKDKSPPKRLLKLVIDTLAQCLDTELWAHLRELIGHEMALQLVEGMISREVKIEQSDQAILKSESDRITDENSAYMVNNGC